MILTKINFCTSKEKERVKGNDEYCQMNVKKVGVKVPLSFGR